MQPVLYSIFIAFSPIFSPLCLAQNYVEKVVQFHSCYICYVVIEKYIRRRAGGPLPLKYNELLDDSFILSHKSLSYTRGSESHFLAIDRHPCYSTDMRIGITVLGKPNK